MNDADGINREKKIQIISKEDTQSETNISNDSLNSSEILLHENGLTDSSNAEVAKKTMEEITNLVKKENCIDHVEDNDVVDNVSETQHVASDQNQEEIEPINELSQESELINNTKVDMKMESSKTPEPNFSELHEQGDLEKGEIEVDESTLESHADTLSSEKNSYDISENACSDHNRGETSSEPPGSLEIEPIAEQHPESNLEEPYIPLEEQTINVISNEFPQLNISSAETKPSIPSSDHEEITSKLNDQRVDEESENSPNENLDSEEINEPAFTESSELKPQEDIDGMENLPSEELPNSHTDEAHDELQVTVDAEVIIENVPSLAINTDKSSVPVRDTENAMNRKGIQDTKDHEVNYSRTLGESFEFVAEDINQLIQKSVEIQDDIKSTRKGGTSTSSPPAVALVDPGCVKEVARSSEKMVAAVLALLDVLQHQLHEMSALTTGYVQMHRDIGFRVTECVDDLLRALYSLISKIEQIDLKMTPLYELGNQVSRLRKSMEQLDKLF